MEARKRARVRDDVEIELSIENESRSESDSAVLSSTDAASSIVATLIYLPALAVHLLQPEEDEEQKVRRSICRVD